MTDKETFDSSDVEKINLGHSVLFRREDGIIQIDCSDNFEYDVEHIKQNLKQIKRLSDSKKVLVLNCAKPFTTVSKEVRDFVASAPHRDYVKAEAFVISTMGQTILGNFFLKINKPIVPAMFFKKREDAEKWLKSFE